jgi:histidine triad (HIT) family protein
VLDKLRTECEFCRIEPQQFVFEDEISGAFLDHRPLFPGHVLLIPKQHYETLGDLPASIVGQFFLNVQRLGKAVETAMAAEGSFVAINNRVSQSVPHLHVHIVPRRKKDGLKGFFWPRHKYGSEEEMVEVRRAIRAALGAK